MFVKKLDTVESELDYGYNHFDFCLAEDYDKSVSLLENLIFSNVKRPGPFNFKFMENVTCGVTCRKTYTRGEPASEYNLMKLKRGTSLNYQHHWIVDNKPVKWCFPLQTDHHFCSTGFPMGCLFRDSSLDDSCPQHPSYNKPGTYYPFNHIELLIKYQSGADEEWGNAFRQNGGRIVSIQATPSSIRHDPANPDCNNPQPLEIPAYRPDNIDIVYTYSIKFIEEKTFPN